MPDGGTPDTLGYMILGYALAGVLLTVLVAYLILKARNLRAEIEMLESLEKEAQDSSAKDRAKE